MTSWSVCRTTRRRKETHLSSQGQGRGNIILQPHWLYILWFVYPGFACREPPTHTGRMLSILARTNWAHNAQPRTNKSAVVTGSRALELVSPETTVLGSHGMLTLTQSPIVGLGCGGNKTGTRRAAAHLWGEDLLVGVIKQSISIAWWVWRERVRGKIRPLIGTPTSLLGVACSLGG